MRNLVPGEMDRSYLLCPMRWSQATSVLGCCACTVREKDVREGNRVAHPLPGPGVVAFVPCSNRTRAISNCPYRDARSNGVYPYS